MKFSITLIFLIFSTLTFGQRTKPPKNLKKAISYLNIHTSDSIKSLIKRSENDTIKNISYPWGGKYKTIYNWTDRDNYGSRIIKYLDEKGVSKHQEEVILIAFKDYLNNDKFNEEEILEPFQKIEHKWKEEDKIRYSTDTLRGHYIPKDLNDSFKTLNRIYSDSTKVQITKLKEEEYVNGNYRPGIGMWMRNNWQLWGGSRLSKFFRDNNINHPESMSVVILKSYYRYLKNENIRFNEQIKIYVEWDEKAEVDKLKREEEELKEKKEAFTEFNIGDVLEFNYNYEFANQSQEDKWMDDTCLAKGILIEKDKVNLKIKVKVIESCDRKGIVIYNNDNIMYYDIETKEWSSTEKRIVKYLKKGKSAWFELDDWETE